MDALFNVGVHFLKKTNIARPLKYVPDGDGELGRFLGIALIAHKAV